MRKMRGMKQENRKTTIDGQSGPERICCGSGQEEWSEMNWSVTVLQIMHHSFT